MYIMSLKYNDKTLENLHIDGNDSSITLKELCHLPYSELSDVSLCLNEYNEVMINTTGKTSLVIERYGRRRQCLSGHPLLLLPKDILWIGHDPVHRFDIVKLNNVTTSARKNRFSRNVILASAAALTMVSAAACNKQYPNEAGGISDHDMAHPESQDNAYPNPPIMGEPPEDDAYPYPQVVGEPAIDESYPDPPVVGKPAIPKDPYPHPALDGEVKPYDEIEESNEEDLDNGKLKPNEEETSQTETIPRPKFAGKIADPKTAWKKSHPEKVGKSL